MPLLTFFSFLEDCGELSEERACPAQNECDTFHWRAGLWGSCSVLNETAQCGPGVRRREAICVTYNSASEIVGRVVPHWRCRGIELPALEEACSKPCPRDCQLTQWAEWTSCEDRCIDEQDLASTMTSTTMSSFTMIMNTQTRYRRVLQWPEDGGQECARLIDVRPCPLQSSQSCQSRSWRPQTWSGCVLPPGKSCGDGLQVRGLDCLEAGSHVDIKECLEDATLMEKPLPKQQQTCSVDCVTGCVTGPWSPWSACSQACPSKRVRSRLLSNKVKCNDISESEEEACSCQSYRYVCGKLEKVKSEIVYELWILNLVVAAE